MKQSLYKKWLLAVVVILLTITLQTVSLFMPAVKASALTLGDCSQFDGQGSQSQKTNTTLTDCVNAGFCRLMETAVSPTKIVAGTYNYVCATSIATDYSGCYSQFSGTAEDDSSQAIKNDSGKLAHQLVSCIAAQYCSDNSGASGSVTCIDPATVAKKEGLQYAETTYLQAAIKGRCGSLRLLKDQTQYNQCASSIQANFKPCFNNYTSSSSFTYPKFDTTVLMGCALAGTNGDISKVSSAYKTEVLAALNAVNGSVETKLNTDLSNAQAATQSSSNQTPDNSSPESCGISGAPGPLNWVMCPITSGLTSLVVSLGGWISNFLYTSPDNIFTSEFKAVWDTFRDVGIALIVIAALVMVISQSLGLDILDAYTIRKLMPRLATTLIGIALSWPLLKLAVVMSNDLGIWAHDLILAPFKGLTAGIGDISGLSQGTLLTGGLIVSVLAGMDFLVILSFMATIALSLLIGMLVLGVRQAIISAVILFSPLAVASYVLPGTQKLWKFWKDTTITTLLMFPIIMGFIALGDALSRVIMSAKPGIGMKMVALIVYFAPYFLLPFAFKLAGGLMSTIFSLANDKNTGLFDRLHKGRQSRMSNERDRIKTGQRWQGNRVAERLSRSLQTGSLIGSGATGVVPWHMRARLQAARSERTSTLANKAAENESVKIVGSNDDLAAAALDGEGTDASARRYLVKEVHQTGQVLEQNVAHIRRARRAVGRQNLEEYLPKAMGAAGTAFKSGPAEAIRFANKVGGSDRARVGRILQGIRAGARESRSVDIYGSSLNEMINQADLLNRGLQNEQSANEILTASALKQTSIYEVGGAHYLAFERMQPAIINRVQQAQQAVTDAQSLTGLSPIDKQKAIEAAERGFVIANAQTESLVDIAGQSSGRNTETIGRIMHQSASSVQNQHTDRAFQVLSSPATPVLGPDNKPLLDAKGNPVMKPAVYHDATIREAIKELGSAPGTSTIYEEVHRRYDARENQATSSLRAAGINPPGTNPPKP